MLRCPRCGTMNSDSSSHCRKCREPLNTNTIECPQCGQANPEGSERCSRCNTPLVVISGVPQEDDSNQFDWLVDLTSESFDAAPGQDDGNDALPDWLSEGTGASSGSAGKKDDAGLDWLSGTLEDQEQDTADTISPDDLPDWMRGDSEESPAEETGSAGEDIYDFDWDLTGAEPDDDEQAVDAPDWSLAFTSDSSDASYRDKGEEKSDETSPSWLGADDVQAGAGKPADVDDLPDWLHRSEPVVSEQYDDDVDGDGIPDWLHSDFSPAARETEPDSIPDWLGGSELNGPTQDEGPDDLPGWLGKRDGMEPAMDFGATASNAEESADDLDWLRGSGDSLFEADSETPEEPVQEDNWLSGLSSAFDDDAGEVSASEADATAAPSWLGDFTPEETDFDEASTPAEDDWAASLSASKDTRNESDGYNEEPAVESSGDSPDAGLPDWLSDFGSKDETADFVGEEAAEESEFSYLDDAGSDDDLFGASTSAETPVEALGDDWLTGFNDLVESEDRTRAQSPDALSATPNQLRGFAAEKPEPKSKSIKKDGYALGDFEQRPAASAPPDKTDSPSKAGQPLEPSDWELPDGDAGDTTDTLDWLGNLTVSSPVAPKQAGDKSQQSFAMPDSADNIPAQAEVPAWMQGLRPEGERALPKFPALVVPPPEDSDLELAELPDWVLALQPGAGAAIQAPSALTERIRPAESKGPLVGLGGTLAALASVDMPEGYKIVAPKLSQDIQKQAKLWQNLLENPRFGQRPVASDATRKTGTGQWVGLLVTFLLFIAIITALLVPSTVWQQASLLSFTPEYEARTGARLLATTIQELQPGDVVLVAVEYGAAQVDEMNLIAATLIEHLNSREGVQIRFASTLPEGVMTAQTLTYLVDEPEGDAQFIISQVSGVAAYLNSADDVDLVLVLTAEFDRLQWWIEQNASLPDDQQRRIAVGMSASLRSLAAPYLRQTDFPGWVAGYPETLLYQVLLNKDLTPELPKINALMLSHWLAAALMLCGMFYYLVSPRKGSR